ncbi:hypothetical protein FAM3228_01541 [Lacticaseibacillus paracasei]|nr:hypothetical protein FAM19353_01504 [Lacticaseibacillus paracasei]RNE13815.1 hypothetical protein FAM3228_01541 [Lacticaseibacillus paracasei]
MSLFYLTSLLHLNCKSVVKKVMQQLHQLQKIIDSQGSVTTFEDRFIVLAKKN